MTNFRKRAIRLMTTWFHSTRQEYCPTVESIEAALYAAYLEGVHQQKMKLIRVGKSQRVYKIVGV